MKRTFQKIVTWGLLGAVMTANLLMPQVVSGAEVVTVSADTVERDTVSQQNPDIFITYKVASTQQVKQRGTYATINEALGETVSGDTIYVRYRKENYVENLDFSEAEDNITLVGISDGDKKPVVDGDGTTLVKGDKLPILSITNKKGITIDNFSLQNSTADSVEVTPIGILINGTSSDITVRNCEITGIKAFYGDKNRIEDANAHGILVAGDTKTPISNVTIEQNEVHGLELGQSESVVINGNVTHAKVNRNEIHDNDNIGIDFIGYEDTCPDQAQNFARESECVGNYVYNISSAKNPAYKGGVSADGIYVDGGKNITIKDNVVRACDIGIEAASEHRGYATENVLIENNLVADCSAYAGICFGGYNNTTCGASLNIQIRNNTLYNNATNLVIQYANTTSDGAINFISKNIFYQSDKNKNNQLYFEEGEGLIRPSATKEPLHFLYDNAFSSDKNILKDLFVPGNFNANKGYTENVSVKDINISYTKNESYNLTIQEQYAGYGYQKTTDPADPTEPTEPTDPKPTEPDEPAVSETDAEINLKKPSIKKISAPKARSFTVTWKKNTEADGYEIQYSTSKSFTGKTTKEVLVTRGAKTSKKIKKCKSGKKYYVRIRTYKQVGETIYYSAWSKTKYKKVK